MKRKTFYTIFQQNDPIVLLKDPGMIPLTMSRFDYDSFFVSYINNNDNNEILKQVPNLNLINIKDDRGKKELTVFSFSIIKFIIKNAKKIDILNLYFLKFSIIYSLIYKILNPKGILYIKLDLDAYAMQKMESQKIEHIRNMFYKPYLKLLPSIVSVEHNYGFNYINKKFGINYPKLIIIPDGIDGSIITDNLKIKKFEEKENIILTVGRIGSEQKNNELLLSAIPKIKNLKNWKIIFVGPIEDNFKKIADQFFEKNPEYKNNILFTGGIYDRKELFRLYNKSKVLCMTTKYESFGLVYVEAQFFGNYIISTDIPSLTDFIGYKNNNMGKLFKNSEELANILTDIINDNLKIKESFNKRIEHGNNFLWSKICENLDKEIKKLIK